jgi:O-acetyl-ADP-ribose deacetylase (regulator of RNase III)
LLVALAVISSTISLQVVTGGCAVLKKDDRYIYYLVTKAISGKSYPTYESLESSLKVMRDHMVQNNVMEIAIPQIGCGLDGLKWNEVTQRLLTVFDETNINMTVYVFVPPK